MKNLKIEEIKGLLIDLKHSINGDCYRGNDFELKTINQVIKRIENLSIDAFHICNECCFDFATCKGKDQKFSDAVLKCNEYKNKVEQ